MLDKPWKACDFMSNNKFKTETPKSALGGLMNFDRSMIGAKGTNEKSCSEYYQIQNILNPSQNGSY